MRPCEMYNRQREGGATQILTRPVSIFSKVESFFVEDCKKIFLNLHFQVHFRIIFPFIKKYEAKEINAFAFLLSLLFLVDFSDFSEKPYGHDKLLEYIDQHRNQIRKDMKKYPTEREYLETLREKSSDNYIRYKIYKNNLSSKDNRMYMFTNIWRKEIHLHNLCEPCPTKLLLPQMELNSSRMIDQIKEGIEIERETKLSLLQCILFFLSIQQETISFLVKLSWLNNYKMVYINQLLSTSWDIKLQNTLEEDVFEGSIFMLQPEFVIATIFEIFNRNNSLQNRYEFQSIAKENIMKSIHQSDAILMRSSTIDNQYQYSILLKTKENTSWFQFDNSSELMISEVPSLFEIDILTMERYWILSSIKTNKN